VTPPIFRPLGQPETRFADEKVVTQENAQQDGLFWLVWKSCFNLAWSTKIEAPPIGLWPKPFSVTWRRLGLFGTFLLFGGLWRSGRGLART